MERAFVSAGNAASHTNGTTSTVPRDVAKILATETVACVPLDGIVPENQHIHFIKVDVEGAEYLALSGCQRIIARCHPVIVSEFSPNLMIGISGISGLHYLEWLISMGYRLSILSADGTEEATNSPPRPLWMRMKQVVLTISISWPGPADALLAKADYRSMY